MSWGPVKNPAIAETAGRRPLLGSISFWGSSRAFEGLPLINK